MKSIHKIFLGILTAVLLAACADDNDFARDSRKTNTGAGKTVTVTASMPGNNSISKVGLSQENNTLNMISQWEQDDEIQLFVYQGGNGIEIGKTPVQNISNDGKSCLFSFMLPTEINPQKTYYVYGLCGIDGSLDDGELTFDAPLKRVPLSEIKAPCFFAVEGNSDELQVRFNHIGAYEILHLANKSDNSITFSHNGYTSETPWYNSGFHGSLKFGTTSKSITYSGENATADIQKVTINSGETASIVSWYYPNGNTISDAVLNAVINGSEINSSDIKSSKTVIQNGKAYHLYATWNGKESKFKETDPFVIEDDIPSEYQENYFDGTLKKVYTCDYGAKTITLYKSVNLENSHVNPDGTLFYLSTFYLDVTDEKGTKHTLITDELYTSANYDLMNLPCMLIDGGKDEISIYSMSKDENQQYSMEGYLFRYDMATEKVTKESVFDYANWGWFPRFELSGNVVKLRHFSYAGYYAMESVCNSDGIWNTDYIGSINPDDYEKETKDKPAVLIIDSNEEEDPEDNTVALSKGLVAYYPFDKDADDYSGNGNNGTVTNLSLVSGVNGNAYKFAGVDDPGWIQIPNSESLQFSDAVSFSMWFNVSSYRGHDGWANTTDYGCLKLFSKDYDRNEIHADLGGFTDDKWRISFWGICNGREGNWIDIEGSILNQWHHVAFVATNNYLKIYIDGNLVNETECESNFSYSNSKDLWIGRLNSYYAYYFNGLIDEFRVYNRALNSTEVYKLYNMYDPESNHENQDVSCSYVD